MCPNSLNDEQKKGILFMILGMVFPGVLGIILFLYGAYLYFDLGRYL